MKNRKFAVIGLGMFGRLLAVELAASGTEVIAVDRNERAVQEIAEQVAHAVVLDATDERALASQGIDQVDAAVVAIGENFEGNILCTLILKHNFKIPEVITRAITDAQRKILQLMNVEVLQPERASALRLAGRLVRPSLIDHIPLADGFSFAQIIAPKSMVGKALKDLELRQRYECNVVSIKTHEHGRERVIGVPHPERRIVAGDLLYLVGAEEQLQRLADNL